MFCWQQDRPDLRAHYGVLTPAAVHPASRWGVPWWPTIRMPAEVSQDRLTLLADPIKGRAWYADLQVIYNNLTFISPYSYVNAFVACSPLFSVFIPIADTNHIERGSTCVSPLSQRPVRMKEARTAAVERKWKVNWKRKVGPREYICERI